MARRRSLRWSGGACLLSLALVALTVVPVKAAEWQTYLSEDFSSTQTMFYTGQAGEAQYSIDEMGRYVIDGLNTGSDSLSSLTDNLYYYYLEVQCELVRTIAGEQAFTGVVFHYNKSIPGQLSYYVFYYYGDGYYGAKRVIGDQVEILIPLTPTDALDMYGVNVLGVDAQGTSFDLYINGRYVDNFTDVRIDGGGFGFYVSKYARAAFDNFSVKVERRPGGRDEVNAPLMNSNVADEGGSADEGYRDYQFPEIPKDPNRPTYSWEVGVDKTRKAKPQEGGAEEQPASEPAPLPPPEMDGLPAEEEEGPEQADRAAQSLRPLQLPPGEELVEPGSQPAEQTAPPATGGASSSAQGQAEPPPSTPPAENGGDAQEVTAVHGSQTPSTPASQARPHAPRRLPHMTVPKIDAPPVDLLDDDPAEQPQTAAGEQQPQTKAGELEIPDLDGNDSTRSTAQAQQRPAETPRLPVVKLPEESDTGGGELSLYPPDDEVNEPPAAGTSTAAEQPADSTATAGGDESVAATKQDVRPRRPSRTEPAVKSPAEPEAEEDGGGELSLYPTDEGKEPEAQHAENDKTELNDLPPAGGGTQPADQGADAAAAEDVLGEEGETAPAEEALPVGETGEDGALRFSSVEPKLEEMGVGRATEDDSTSLEDLDWQAVPIEPVSEEAEQPAADVDLAKLEQARNAAQATEQASEPLPLTPQASETQAGPNESPDVPPDDAQAPVLQGPAVPGTEYYSGDALAVIADDFSTEHWPVSAADGGGAGYRYFGGAYEIDNLKAQTMAISFQDGSLADSEFSIDAEFIEGAGQVGYGIASRLSVKGGAVSYYGLFICQNGELMLLKVHQGSEQVLSDWRASSLIKPGQPNRLALDVRGGMLYAYVNGQLAATVADSELTAGGYALLAGPGVAVRFDNLRIHGFSSG